MFFVFNFLDKNKKKVILCNSNRYDISPYRLEAKDISLSRRKQGFKFPWGYFLFGKSKSNKSTFLVYG